MVFLCCVNAHTVSPPRTAVKHLSGSDRAVPEGLGALTHVGLELMAEMELVVESKVPGNGSQALVTVPEPVFGSVEPKAEEVPHGRKAH